MTAPKPADPSNAQATGQVLSAPPRRSPKPPGPCAMVIFGAAGDLTKRLLVPALYNLASTGLLPEHFTLIGVDMADITAEQWRDSLHAMMESFVGKAASESRIDKVDDATWTRLTQNLSFVRGDMTDEAFYAKLKTQLTDRETATRTGGNCLFYLAVADRFFAPVVTHLGAAGLFDEGRDADAIPPAGGGW